MTAEIFRLPVRPTLRAVPTFQSHFEIELRHIAIHLHAASGHFRQAARGPAVETGISAGSEELEAALFHALTLKGCRNADGALREMLLQRLIRREEVGRD